MRRWFLSYHSPDHALAERLKAALERKDAGARVFFAPQHMRAGGFWTAQLAQELADADAFILLIGEHGLGKWQVPEYDEALDRRVKARFPLVLMLLDGQTAPGLPFLRQLHWIVTPDPASDKDVACLIDAAAGADAQPAELWRYTSPYRGLSAMEEKDADNFFARERETVDVLNALAAESNRLPVLLGNSGVGKSSLAQAGVLAALKRQAWPERANIAAPWPHAFNDSRRWCFLSLKPGTEPLRALTEAFIDTWLYGATDAKRVRQQNEWVELLHDGKATLRDLLDATERRYGELQQPKPAAFLVYVDQGEELYVRAEEGQRRRFSELLAQALSDPRLRALMSLRSDFLGALQGDEPLFNARRQIDVPPLREAALRAVVSSPPALLGARFETDHLPNDIAERAAAESAKDAGALPLLSYLLDDMWTRMVERGDGTLRLPATSIDLGRVLAERADAFLARNPKSEDRLRRVFTLKLATVREDGEPTRRRAVRSEFSDEEWRLVSALADHPNRLLVTATPQEGDAFAEVAHEAIFKRWEKLRDWIAAEREFLVWRSGLERDRRRWANAPDSSKHEALLMGHALAQAQGWIVARPGDLPAVEREFVDSSIRQDASAREEQHRLQRQFAKVGGALALLFLGIVVGLLYSGMQYQVLRDRLTTLAEPRPISLQEELALQPGQSFKECAVCPEMVVIPAGEFMMGSLPNEQGHQNTEHPRHAVTIPKAFAVSRFEVSSDEWATCLAIRECEDEIYANRGDRMRPVRISWNGAQRYVSWLSKVTGKSYRLLSEAEWEYAARAGTSTRYHWGNDIGKGNANCQGCGSRWDLDGTVWDAPVGSFAPNAFGLHDMHGNALEWTEDVWNGDYSQAPSDGSARVQGEDSNRRVARGGSVASEPDFIRSASRHSVVTTSSVGIRVGRTLTSK